MVCPYCQKELTPGFIKCPKPFVWSPDKDLGFVNTEAGDILLTQTYWKGLLDGFSVESHFCPDCKVIITSLKK